MSDTRRALIVDDEPDICDLLSMTLKQMDIDSRDAQNVADARKLLGSEAFDFCLTDMRLPDGDGLDLVSWIRERFPDLPIAVITAHGNVESAVEALKRGAFDFVSKPIKLQNLRNLVANALQLAAMAEGVGRRPGLSLLGNSPPIQGIRDSIAKLARSQAPVYISGESGTGKELVARLIHAQGPRAEQPFLAVNCGAIPAELMESELFGHKKGSFTGAFSDKQGMFQAASGGTLFLDEIAELPLPMQAKLLRVLQERAVRPVGANQELPVNVRIISATHQDLADLVSREVFRQDLYYRINVIHLDVPRLAERSSDIPLLATHFLDRIARRSGISRPSLSAEAVNALQHYSFPGNVRELENIIERAVALCEDGRITPDDLVLPSTQSLQSAPQRNHGEPLDDYLNRIEREAITSALEAARFNKTAAAKQLGITFRALRYKLDKLGIE